MFWVAAAMVALEVAKGASASRQKKNEAAIYKYNAAVKRQEAEAIRRRTLFQQKRQAEYGARIMGFLEASIGGSGTVSTQGAPLLAMALQQDELEMENYLIGYQGRLEAEQVESAAGEFDMMKKITKSGASQAMTGGFLSAGSAAINTYSSWPKKTTPSTSFSLASTGSGGYGGTMGGGPTGGASRSMLG